MVLNSIKNVKMKQIGILPSRTIRNLQSARAISYILKIIVQLFSVIRKRKICLLMTHYVSGNVLCYLAYDIRSSKQPWAVDFSRNGQKSSLTEETLSENMGAKSFICGVCKYEAEWTRSSERYVEGRDIRIFGRQRGVWALFLGKEETVKCFEHSQE